jgi:molybdopterin/thiamine biosynthesis adenylyltransferase/rhodanese-related sulfurtransferase
MKHLQERYQRQLILNDFGLEAQEKLSNAKVLVIGAGGLGCPILQYLVAAGVGHIGIADDDTISYSNLNRQILFGQQDVGSFKVDIAKEKLLLMNDTITIKTWKQRWSQKDCINHFKDYAIIVDATDNFASRYLINDACVLLGKPLVFGAVSKFEGQVAVFNVPINEKEKTVNYRDLFPEPPNNDEVLNCSEAGVLGVLPGMIGVLQATEVIKLITGIGKPLTNRILTYNALNQEFFTMYLTQNPQASNYIPASVEAFENTDYELLCNYSPTNVPEIETEQWLEIRENTILVDVRELTEKPRLDFHPHLSIPLASLNSNLDNLLNKEVVFVCQSGKRSLKAALLYLSVMPNTKVYSLKGGVNELVKKKLI